MDVLPMMAAALTMRAATIGQTTTVSSSFVLAQKGDEVDELLHGHHGVEVPHP
ncbi:hypothetical protein D3C83_91200 [compost metagenome]